MMNNDAWRVMVMMIMTAIVHMEAYSLPKNMQLIIDGKYSCQVTKRNSRIGVMTLISVCAQTKV